MAALVPNLKPPTNDELAALVCDTRSGVGADPAMTVRLVREIRDLRQALLWRDSRMGTVGVDVVSRVPELPETIGRRA